MSEPAFLDAATVRALEPLAAARGVSEIARARGFTRAFEEAGDAKGLGEPWRARRRAFIARHVAQARINHERWWLPSGEPTRRHLALAMWAWSPTRPELLAFVESRRRNVGPHGALRAFYDRAALASRREIGDRTLELPRLDVVEASSWGGRFEPATYPRVVLYPAPTDAMNKAIVVHELAHWIRHHTGDPRGHHDRSFCRVLARMYARMRIPLSAQRAVEREGGCLAG